MTTVLAVLDTVVERFGPAALADPLALAAALRGLPDPLPEDQIGLLTAAVASGAPGRLRTELEAGAPVPAALAEAVALASGAGSGMPAEVARWAVTQLGCAGGLLPRHMADQEAVSSASPPPPGAGEPPARRTRGRAVPVLAAGAVVAVAAVAALTWTQLGTAADTGTDAAATPSPSAAPSTTAPALPAADPTPSTSQAPETATDPLEVFRAPELRRLAEIYVKSGGVQCRTAATPLGVQEAVACNFGDHGVVGIFYKYLGPETLSKARDGLIGGEVTAKNGTVRQLWWRFLNERAGTKYGIPMGVSARAEGLRVRFHSSATSTPTLYFDQESTLCSGLFTSPTADRTELREFWADPQR
ncbi:hypothetical protein [Actinoplanes sp. NPDC026670]|uniref:hypothetical protein n=1 Tax=Actinoplanes sp. NPDC026670 TaxID=3154700 RepID=UPI0033DD684C